MRYQTETRTAPCGARYLVEWAYDEDSGAPETEADGHGVVVEMHYDPEEFGDDRTASDGDDMEQAIRHKLMRRLSGYDRSHRYGVKYYDVWATRAKAKAEGWGITNPVGLSPDEIIDAAVEADFTYLYGWYNDHWHWCGITVTLLDTDEESSTEWESSLWGVNSDDDKYHEEVITELVADALGRKATTAITEEVA